MRDAIIASAVRTPVGRYMGALKDVAAYNLAVPILNRVVERAGITSEDARRLRRLAVTCSRNSAIRKMRMIQAMVFMVVGIPFVFGAVVREMAVGLFTTRRSQKPEYRFASGSVVYIKAGTQ